MNTCATTASSSIPSEKKNYKWLLALIMVTVIALGWKFPLLGFVVPFAMVSGIIGGFFRGRWVCGNLCPRGSFLDTWFSLVSAKKQSPPTTPEKVIPMAGTVCPHELHGVPLTAKPERRKSLGAGFLANVHGHNDSRHRPWLALQRSKLVHPLSGWYNGK